MKKLIQFTIILFWAVSLFAQTTEKFSYQSVIRNANEELLSNTQIGIRISILQGSDTGSAVYVENHTIMNNANGLVSFEIGGGSGFDEIDWANGPYFMKTEVDPAGGTNYSITGVSQLLFVPFALHAKTAETTTEPITETDPLWTASPSFGITGSNISNWNTAFGWGDHSTAGYMTSFTETDPLWTASPSFGITDTNISNWNTAFGWGDHSTAGYTPITRTLTINGTGYDLAADRNWNVGTVTSIATGDGLTGGPIISSGTISIPNNGIASAMLQNNSVTSAKIADGTIEMYDLGDNTVTSSKIVDGSISDVDLSNNSVTSAHIVNGTLATEDLANSSVTTDKISNLGANTNHVLQFSGTSVNWDYAPGALIKYSFLNANCPNVSVNFSNTYTKIANIGTISKMDETSKLEVTFYGRVSVNTFDNGSTGAYFELRVDDSPTIHGRANVNLRTSDAGSSGVSVCFMGVFSGLSAGNHTVSMWVRSGGSPSGTGTGAFYNPGCWLGDYVIVREIK